LASEVAGLVANSKTEDATAPEMVERLISATPGGSVASLAGLLGVSHQAVYNAKNKSKIPKSWIVDVSESTGFSADWLLTGKGSPKRGMGSNSQEPACDVDMVYVPMVEARLSAGTGSFETGDESERRYGFRADFLARKGQMSQMVLMRVDGDSMEPEIHHGDVVLIDQSQTTPRAGALYAVGVEDLVYIKMVDTLPGKIILKSCNSAYSHLEIDARGDLSNGIRIIGKAVWLGRELR
jgi:phage repressor protein C with HTH and peptisase S24 domain